MRVALIIAVFAVVAGCTNARSITRDIVVPSRMVEVILSRVPVGTPIEDAEQFMQQEGFNCSRIIGGRFGDRKRLDYVYCDRSEGSGLVERRWQVALVHREGKVSELLASTGLVGP